ncbi:MAG: CocE/NonD family hydrolase [Chloroflexi bacterium]|nr:CocE/NonD family hydrolase [Chloroflexota bacterium]
MPEEVICDSNVEVPMRDGVRLECDVVRPRPPGKYPVLVVRSPYGREAYVDDPGHSVWFFAQRGYAVVTQDCRARFGSEGESYDPLFQEVEDGFDTVEWAARQSWSNGRVGTTGQSYMGATQYTLATNNPLPPHLQTMAPVSASSDFHQSWVYHTGGAMEWGWMVPYAIHKGINTLERMGRNDLVKEVEGYLEPGENFARPLTGDWYRHLPLSDWAELLKETAPYFGDYLANERDGPYWWRVNLNRHLAGISVPMLHVSSWYDIFLEGALNAFAGISEKGANQLARENQKLLVGPWAHLLPYNKPTSGDTGEIDFGDAARIELHDYLLRWFDHWLKDLDTGVMDESPVRLFIMGENRWRTENEWPLARTEYTRFYLHSDGNANSRHGSGSLSLAPPGDEPPDSYVYDPSDPVPTQRGNTLIIPYGVADQREVEERADVLVYTSDPLDEDLEITGPITVHLFAASDATDTDFTAKLVDVRPDGYAQNLQDGMIRTRFRDSASNPSPIEPGRVYAYEIDLWATSHVVRTGHRLRIEVSSSNFPRFDRNPNTGAPFGRDDRLSTARQEVHHSAARPSHVVLPVIPR